jgi:heme/copper-type cytochrome/quinol oxidase subunit 3
MSDIAITAVSPTPRSARGRHHPAAWWGMVMLITTESMVFAGLISANFYVRSGSKHWPQGGIRSPDLGIIVFFSVILLASSLPVWWAERGILRGDVRRLRLGLATAFLMGAAFLAFTVHDIIGAEFGWTANAYASLFFTIVGLHAMHVAAGLAMSAGVQAKAATGRIDGERHMTVRMFAMYWHFVDAVWVVVFTSLYLTVHR